MCQGLEGEEDVTPWCSSQELTSSSVSGWGATSLATSSLDRWGDIYPPTGFKDLFLSRRTVRVVPTIYFGSPHLQPNAPTLPDSHQELREVDCECQAWLSCDCAGQLRDDDDHAGVRACAVPYNMSVYVTAAMARNVLPQQICELVDLTTLMTRFRPDATSARFNVVWVNRGGNDQTTLILDVNEMRGTQLIDELGQAQLRVWTSFRPEVLGITL
ncbi:hypothetical protein BJY52DRAFT_1400472 [Lactarius psammicola]|nr:hypothetical protein BJY52DRAFT_1400472 [Lactarius psammicola]